MNQQAVNIWFLLALAVGFSMILFAFSSRRVKKKWLIAGLIIYIMTLVVMFMLLPTALGGKTYLI